MEIDDLRKTADMARLCVNEQESQETLAALNDVLAYLDIMQAYDGAGADVPAPLCRFVDSAHFRYGNASIDAGPVADATADAGAFADKEMLERAPEKDGRFIVIPNVL